MPKYGVGLPFLETGITAVVDKMSRAYIDCAGSVLIRPYVIDNGLDHIQAGSARFAQDGMVGFLDRSARIKIPARYRYAEPFDNGFALIRTDCKETRSGEHTAVRRPLGRSRCPGDALSCRPSTTMLDG